MDKEDSDRFTDRFSIKMLKRENIALGVMIKDLQDQLRVNENSIMYLEAKENG